MQIIPNVINNMVFNELNNFKKRFICNWLFEWLYCHYILENYCSKNSQILKHICTYLLQDKTSRIEHSVVTLQEKPSLTSINSRNTRKRCIIRWQWYTVFIKSYDIKKSKWKIFWIRLEQRLNLKILH